MIQYIFSINTGRSGSQYLSKILSCFNYISAHHEPDPVGIGKPMIAYNDGDEQAMQQVVHSKKQFILDSLVPAKTVYAETNHAFIKGFGWLLVPQLDMSKMGVVILKRNESEIIKSLRRIKTTPLNESGRVWLLSPLSTNNLLSFSRWGKFWFKNLFRLQVKWPNNKLVQRFIAWHESYYLKWYLKEQEARTKLFMEKFPNIRYFETNITQLNTEAELKKMFAFFEMPYEPNNSLYELLGKAANLKKVP